MSASVNLSFSAEKREQAGKGVARALRRENKIPAVIYGDHKPPVTITVSAKDMNLAYNRGAMFTTLSDIDVEGEKFLTLARDVQLDPVRDFVMHVDFLRVGPKTKITVNVPVQFLNEEEAPFTLEKGILNVVRHEIEVHCVATNIPEVIEVDLLGFEIGDAVKSSNIAWPEGSKPVIDDRDFTIATIAAPKTAAQEEAEAEENAADIEAAAEGEEGEGEAEGGDAPAEAAEGEASEG